LPQALTFDRQVHTLPLEVSARWGLIGPIERSDEVQITSSLIRFCAPVVDDQQCADGGAASSRGRRRPAPT
jgi:hypothetical protein